MSKEKRTGMTLRMTEAEARVFDRVRKHHGLPSVAAMIHFLVVREAREMGRIAERGKA